MGAGDQGVGPTRDAGPLERLRRHWRWAREQGVGRLVEEDDLHPVRRTRTAIAKWRWRRAHGVVPGTAQAVYLVGLQRSGTNMVVRGLEAEPEFEVHNENDRRVFAHFRLRDDAVVRRTVAESRHRYVLFKPLCDSHRVDELLALTDGARPGLAIWAYRSVDGRVRSAVAKFGDANRRVLAEISAGGGTDTWQAQRLSGESLELIRSFDYSTMSAESGAALFWYVRNSLFFELGLDRRGDVLLSSYEGLVAEPERATRALCCFLGFPWRAALADDIGDRTPGRLAPLELDVRVRQLCTDLAGRLDAHVAQQRTTLDGP